MDREESSHAFAPFLCGSGLDFAISNRVLLLARLLLAETLRALLPTGLLRTVQLLFVRRRTAGGQRAC
jgi:hypothetical protein